MTGILNVLLGFSKPGLGPPFTEIITFNGSATWTCPTGVTEIEYLIVAGGGGSSGGGGGGGGFRTASGVSVAAGSTYTITVGAGGAGTPNFQPNSGVQGGNSSIAGPSPFTTITSTGGGFGGGYAVPGGNGGSGGGAGNDSGDPGGTGNSPVTSPSQGNNGGSAGPGGFAAGGGGGGANAAAANYLAPGGAQQGDPAGGGNGGNGEVSSITGSSVPYAGGGGGGCNTSGASTPGLELEVLVEVEMGLLLKLVMEAQGQQILAVALVEKNTMHHWAAQAALA
jgi:hypothetical protein